LLPLDPIYKPAARNRTIPEIQEATRPMLALALAFPKPLEVDEAAAVASVVYVTSWEERDLVVMVTG